MQEALPVHGAVLWIRQTRWRVERARRDKDVVRLDVVNRTRRVTFLAPFDRPVPVAAAKRARWTRPQHALARLAGLLARTGSSRSVFAPVDANLEIFPYQLEPVLAVLSGARRVLIADEVGLGKTIQAGLILAELQRRHDALRALVVPSAVRTQWRDELWQRFLIDAFPADAGSIDRLARSGPRSDDPWRRPGVWLASLDYLKQPHVRAALPSLPWDLLILDEAHGVCGDSARYAAAADLARRSRRVVLLTATPHSGDEARFARLLDLGGLPSAPDALVVFRRTRRELALPVTRRVRWQRVRLSLDEARLFDVLTAFERTVLQAAGEPRRNAALLLLSVFRKRALSTAGALLASLERRLCWLEHVEGPREPDWRQGHLDFQDRSDDVSAEEELSLVADLGLAPDHERSWLRRLRDLARAASRQESKVAHVLSLVRRSAEPVAIFTEFRDSLSVLRERTLPIRSTVVLHGGMRPEEQQQQLASFLDGSASLLLATDVASQGLNLQSRCRWIINFELPWNPVRIEQRAGRVDRIGQRRRVHVTLLVAGHDAETGVLARLARRTLSAQQSFGEDILRATAPDERLLPAHVLAGAPLEPLQPPSRTISICRSWSRQAQAIARHVRRKRALARRWRAPAKSDGTCWTTTSRLPMLRALTGRSVVLVFSVPLIDRSGGVVERRIVALRVDDRLATVLKNRRVLDVARQTAARVTAARARRLRSIRRDEAGRASTRERAIADVLAADRHREELQTGLFDHRAARAAERVARIRGGVRQDLQEQLRAFEDFVLVEVGRPVLDLVFGSWL